MDEILHNRTALFRYRIIAPLVSKGETISAECGKFFRYAASTVNRYVSMKRADEVLPENEMLRYELQHINEVWYGDTDIGPYLKDGKKKIRTMIAGIGIFTNDNRFNFFRR